MPPEQHEIDRALASLSPQISRAVEKRFHLVSDSKGLSDLIDAATLDEELAPIVERAKRRDEAGRKPLTSFG